MTKSAFKELQFADKQKLYDLGFRQWDDPNKGTVLMLIPGGFYKYIPSRFPVVSINGKKELFSSTYSDNDTRFGMLPYGIVVKEIKIKKNK